MRYESHYHCMITKIKKVLLFALLDVKLWLKEDDYQILKY